MKDEAPPNPPARTVLAMAVDGYNRKIQQLERERDECLKLMCDMEPGTVVGNLYAQEQRKRGRGRTWTAAQKAEASAQAKARVARRQEQANG